MKGKKIGDAAAVAEIAQAAAEKAEEATQKATQAANAASSAVETANEASQAASEAKNTADSIAGTANEAKAQSQAAAEAAGSAKIIAERNDGLLIGSLKWPNQGNITIYTGNFVDGSYDPLSVTGQIPNSKIRSISLEYATSATRTLTLRSWNNFLGQNKRGELIVTVVGGRQLNIIAQTTNQGYVSPVTNNYNGNALYVFRITLTGNYGTLECIYNCKFFPANPLQTLLPTGSELSGVAGGDLAGTYPNPTIKESVILQGAPKATTPPLNENALGIATTQFVKTSPKRYTYGPQDALWREDGQIFLLPNRTTQLYIGSQNGQGLQYPPISNACAAYTCYVISMQNASIIIGLYFADGLVDKYLTFSGLSTTSPTLIKIILVLSSDDGTMFGQVQGTLAYK